MIKITAKSIVKAGAREEFIATAREDRRIWLVRAKRSSGGNALEIWKTSMARAYATW